MTTIEVALLIFPANPGIIQDKTIELIREWVNYSPTEKNGNQGDQKPTLTNSEENASKASIFSIFSGHKNSVIRAKSPLEPIPADVSYLIWGYLSPSELATASLVCKAWYTFSKNLLRSEIVNAVFTGTIIKKVIPIKVQGRKHQLVQCNLKTIVLHDDCSLYKNYNLILAIFEETDETTQIYKNQLQIYNGLIAIYSQYPAVILRYEPIVKPLTRTVKRELRSAKSQARSKKCNLAFSFLLGFIALQPFFGIIGALMESGSQDRMVGIILLSVGFLLGIIIGTIIVLVKQNKIKGCQ